ncbi:MAG: membrane protein insertion efficiency factor YidD [Clostridia bacterium]|nr:membrane protein insertion efficiency factor YidD [Clostridia bacterium]
MKYLCIRLIRFYQKFLSPRKRTPTCRFSPTCSAFAIEAFQKRGFFAGMVLTFFRILRCNPFCPGGYDPVPERGITVRSYYASRAGGRVEDDSDDMIDGEDEETRSDTVNREFDPAAGGQTTDRGEMAAEDGDTPKRACIRFVPEDKAPR